ncbi:MAG: hypothetical protein J6Q65_05600 [Lentisphaeria bacterium]|nr:hypothetical protein [Lentisphaeria bacterium]
MHRYYPFDSVILNGREIPDNGIIAASMRFLSDGDDTTITTADGKIHFLRRTLRRLAEFSLYGDHRTLQEQKIVSATFQWNGNVFFHFPTALIRTDHDESQDLTRVQITEILFP